MICDNTKEFRSASIVRHIKIRNSLYDISISFSAFDIKNDRMNVGSPFVSLLITKSSQFSHFGIFSLNLFVKLYYIDQSSVYTLVVACSFLACSLPSITVKCMTYLLIFATN